MNGIANELTPAQRRAELIERSEALRQELAGHHRQFYDRSLQAYERFDAPLRVARSAAGFVSRLRHSPLLATVLGMVLMKTPWRRLAPVPGMAWRGYKMLRFFRGLVS